MAAQQDALGKQLEAKCDELERLQQSFEKLGKENRNLSKFNDDLRQQVKLLTGKLNLHQTLDRTLGPQGDPPTGQESAGGDYCPTCKTRLTGGGGGSAGGGSSAGGGGSGGGWQAEASARQVPIKELVASAAQETFSLNDYVYDESSRTYYSKSTGWYYYRDSGLFYDPTSRNYYRYDAESKQYTFYSSLDEPEKGKEKEAKQGSSSRRQSHRTDGGRREKKTDSDSGRPKRPRREQSDQSGSASEDGEVSSSGSSQSDTDSSDGEYRVQLPPGKACIQNGPRIRPCMRLIVEQSDTLPEGSLLLVTCMGGRLGTAADSELCIGDPQLEPQHARITFDSDDESYWLRDLDSRHGSFVNDRLLDGQRRSVRLRHADRLRFGGTRLLAHVHEKDHTCEECEPGCVQARLAEENRVLERERGEISAAPVLSKRGKEEQRRREMRQLQKKYGLNPYAEQAKAGATAAGGSSSGAEYQDRAEDRRKTKGSDCAFEKTDLCSTSVDKPIATSNKGYQLLQKSGWQAPTKKELGSKLIELRVKDNRKGLGG